ncbi:MAG: hypothetical protein GC129_01500 [Proteobacteria bacterium]|nr:hypothetical protein [Pseudomonadota bacterium]
MRPLLRGTLPAACLVASLSIASAAQPVCDWPTVLTPAKLAELATKGCFLGGNVVISHTESSTTVTTPAPAAPVGSTTSTTTKTVQDSTSVMPVPQPAPVVPPPPVVPPATVYVPVPYPVAVAPVVVYRPPPVYYEYEPPQTYLYWRRW